MKKQTFGNIIVSLRKEKGMTQLELAEKMGVTDKAVSKWDLSFPDISSIPKLAEIFEVSVDDLMQVKTKTKETPPDNKINEIIPLALNGVALAMGIAVVVLLFLNEIEINLAIRMLAIGLVCLAIMQLIKKE